MKSYEEMAANVLKRRTEYISSQKNAKTIKFNNKWLALLIPVLVISTYLIYMQFNPIEISLSGKLSFYATDLKSLEDESEIIASITVTDKKEQIINYINGRPDGYTLREIVVDKIYKSPENIKSGDILTISEPVFEYTIIIGMKFMQSIEGYRPLLKEKNYLVFLTKSMVHKGTYYCTGLYQGKYLVDDNIRNYFDSLSSDDLDINDSISDIQKYKEIYKAVLKKYV